MMQILNPDPALDSAVEDAAAATVRRAAARADAPTTDIDLVLDVLFGDVLS
jgi:hypothetical protein